MQVEAAMIGLQGYNGATEASAAATQEDWQVERVENLEQRGIEAREQGRHLFVWDKAGQAPLYFENFGIHKEFTLDMVSVALEKSDVQSVLYAGLMGLRSALA